MSHPKHHSLCLWQQIWEEWNSLLKPLLAFWASGPQEGTELSATSCLSALPACCTAQTYFLLPVTATSVLQCRGDSAQPELIWELEQAHSLLPAPSSGPGRAAPLHCNLSTSTPAAPCYTARGLMAGSTDSMQAVGPAQHQLQRAPLQIPLSHHTQGMLSTGSPGKLSRKLPEGWRSSLQDHTATCVHAHRHTHIKACTEPRAATRIPVHTPAGLHAHRPGVPARGVEQSSAQQSSTEHSSAERSRAQQCRAGARPPPASARDWGRWGREERRRPARSRRWRKPAGRARRWLTGERGRGGHPAPPPPPPRRGGVRCRGRGGGGTRRQQQLRGRQAGNVARRMRVVGQRLHNAALSRERYGAARGPKSIGSARAGCALKGQAL